MTEIRAQDYQIGRHECRPLRYFNTHFSNSLTNPKHFHTSCSLIKKNTITNTKLKTITQHQGVINRGTTAENVIYHWLQHVYSLIIQRHVFLSGS